MMNGLIMTSEIELPLTADQTYHSDSRAMWVNKRYWADLIQRVGKIDLGDPLPDLDAQFVSVWASHYASIAEMTRPMGAILEIGVGYGVLAAGLARYNKGHVIATEHPSRRYLFRKTYHTFLQTSGVSLVAQNLKEGLPFQDRRFDLIYGCDVIEHLMPEHVSLFLNEILRTLKPGGKFLLSTPNLWRLSNRVRKMLGWSVQTSPESTYAGGTLGHVQEFTHTEMIQCLEDHGFQFLHRRFGLIPYFTNDTFGDGNRFSKKSSHWINRLTALLHPLMPSLGDEMYILSCKP